MTEVSNGGFSQFVYNSNWNEDTVRYVREGLHEMGAINNLELFNDSAMLLDKIGFENIAEYLDKYYFENSEEKNIFNSFDGKFIELQEAEDLALLNSQWLRHHEKLEVLGEGEFQERISMIVSSVPDRDSRKQRSLENEPRYMKLIRALCKESSHEFNRVTIGDPSNEYEGVQVLSWFFITNLGLQCMIEHQGEAIMFKGESQEVIVKIAAGPEYGE